MSDHSYKYEKNNIDGGKNMKGKAKKLTVLLFTLVMFLILGLNTFADIGTENTNIYNFYVDGIIVETQILKEGEHLLEPATPVAKEHKKFVGWHVEGESVAIEFSQPVEVTDNGKTIKVEAKYEDICYVYFVFYNADNFKTTITTKEVLPGAKVGPDGV